ncbi:GNAT family N-acetyltransferase [Actinomadura sp. LOL_016]|uniref:GNAT family N-acetyltransferase n=1 Tax=unclassified Actinomadura TaxID=2626254 RepID=UPI003A80B16D
MINSGPRVSGPTSGPRKVSLRRRPYDHPDAVHLVRALFDDQVERYGYADPVEAAAPAAYTPPEGLFLVAYQGETPVACGGYRTHDLETRTIEIKKMYAFPELRGSGLGRLILNELEWHAARAGFQSAILETGVRNTSALALYTGAGYRPRSRYATDYRDPEINRAFVKELVAGS